MKAFLLALFDSDARAAEIGLVLGALGVVAFIGLAGFDVLVRGRPFDMQGYGAGLGLVMTATGVAAWGQGLGRKAQGPPVA